MIEIKCTEAEKEQLIIVLSSGGQCPFAMSQDKPILCRNVPIKCNMCVADNIEWKTERTEK